MRVVVLLIAALLLLLSLPGCVSLGDLSLSREPLSETTVRGERGPKILLLPISGVIDDEEEQSSFLNEGSESTVARVREELDLARDDSDIRAIVLRIDSPGGGATAADLIYRELLRFKKDRDIPIVAQFMSVAASGGYYVAMAADEVRALPTSVTGSIGVIFVGVNFAGLMDKLGIENQTITSAPSKDAGSPLRRLRPEERAHLQSIVDEMYVRFRTVVQAGRPELSEAQLDLAADGRIFSADQAMELGLIDEVGDLEDAFEVARKRAGLEKAQVIRYHRPSEYHATFYTRAPTGAPILPAELSSLIGRMPKPGFHYLWWPMGE